MTVYRIWSKRLTIVHGFQPKMIDPVSANNDTIGKGI